MHTINEYLRINAIRRMLSYVDVRTSEVVALVLFAAVFALFEGAGLSLLLPILQYAESGQTAIAEGGGALWIALAKVMEVLHLPATLPVLLLMAFVPILMRQVVFYLSTWYSAIVAGRIGVRMRMTTLDAVLEADPEFFDRHALGHIVGVVITQTGVAGLAILSVIKQLTIALLILLYIVILLAVSVPLTLATIVFAGVVSLVVKANITWIRSAGAQVAEVSQQMMGKIVERFSMIRLIKLRDQERAESKRIAEYSETLRALSVRQARLGANIEVTADPLLMLAVFITLYVGISVLGMTLAQLGLVLFVLTRLNAKLKEFNAGRQLISQNMAGLVLVRQMTADAERSNRIRSGSRPFDGIGHELTLDAVSFAYPEDPAAEKPADETGDRRVLRDISLTVPAGSLTALVGRSGGGKSTLVELLPRLREATSGSITFDGVDIAEFEVGSLRKGIGFLTQSAMLFNESVYDNLTYGLDFDPSPEQIRSAIEGAYATFVYDLPQGLETKLGDRGVRLSGGERQRIALARVLLEDSSLLILDEPTSALDSESEGYIQQALSKLHGTKTIIVIAHRLATVIEADQLIVIDEGRIVEQGTHSELIAKGAAYQKLFESQLL